MPGICTIVISYFDYFDYLDYLLESRIVNHNVCIVFQGRDWLHNILPISAALFSGSVKCLIEFGIYSGQFSEMMSKYI